jgi:hypothetical protein
MNFWEDIYSNHSSALFFILLACIFVFMAILYCFVYHSFVVSFCLFDFWHRVSLSCPGWSQIYAPLSSALWLLDNHIRLWKKFWIQEVWVLHFLLLFKVLGVCCFCFFVSFWLFRVPWNFLWIIELLFLFLKKTLLVLQ